MLYACGLVALRWSRCTSTVLAIAYQLQDLVIASSILQRTTILPPRAEELNVMATHFKSNAVLDMARVRFSECVCA